MLGTFSLFERTVLRLVLRREETHTDNYFLSSVPTYLTSSIFDHETHVEFNVERSVGWRDPQMPLLGDYYEFVCPPCAESLWRPGELRQRPLHGTSSLQLSRSDSPERKGVLHMKNFYSAMVALSPSSNQLQRGWEEVGLEGLNCGLSSGRIWGRMSEKREDAKHLSGQIEVPFSLHVETHTCKAGSILHTVPNGPYSLFHLVLTTLCEAGPYF